MNILFHLKRVSGLVGLWLGAFSVLGQGVEPVRVFVEFQPGRKAAVLSALQQAGGRVHYQFDTLSAVAVTLPQPALAGLSRNPNVVLVEEDPLRHPDSDLITYGVDMVQAPMVWNSPSWLTQGGGITVGVIDSGVYAGHQDFAGSDVTGDLSDGCGHGTHVAGTIAAAMNDFGLVGVAPGARIHSVRVFGNDCNWTYASTLVAAVQSAINAGAKVINMSLGGSFKSRTEENAFKQFAANGVLCIASAGNSGTTQLNYPASYASVVSVAALDASKVVADFSQKNKQVEVAAPGVGVLSTVPYVTPSVTAGTTLYPAGAMEFSAMTSVTAPLVDGGLALVSDMSTSWNGQVVLVQRGEISFYEKVLNVQSVGGVGVILYNNVEGGFSGTLGEGNSSTIPAVSITLEDGTALLSRPLGSAVTVNNPVPSLGSGYAFYDGTSMAAPHVSGVAALIWSAYPCATAAQVRQAMQATAEDLGAAGRDASYGYGLVQADGALAHLAGLGLNCEPIGPGDDGVPPVISEVRSDITNAKNGSFEITWTTDEPATSDVELNGTLYSSATLTTAHKRNFRGTKGASYEYYVQSTDAAGNTARSGPHTHRN
jgi:subtilisin family serine protease